MIPSRGDSKGPCLTTWKEYQSVLPTQKQIEAWSEQFRPQRWGPVTGQLSGIVGIDFDGEAGTDWLIKWDLTPHVKSGGGGYHVYVKHPGWLVPTMNSRTAKNIWPWPGVDIRGDGGYINLLGSNANGSYDVLRDIDPLPWESLPEDLRQFLHERSKSHKSTTVAEAPPVVNGNGKHDKPIGSLLLERALASSVNGRNDAGFWLSAQLRDNKFPFTEAESWLRQYHSGVGSVNAKGQAERYEWTEAMASLRSAYGLPPREPWQDSKRDAVAPVMAPDAAPLIANLVTEIIQSKDVGRCYDSQLFSLLAAAPDAALAVRTQLKQAFKGELVFRSEGNLGWDQRWKIAIQQQSQQQREAPVDSSDGSLRQIVTTHRQLREISFEAVEEIRRLNEPPSLFARSGKLVHVVRDELERPSVLDATEDYLRGVLARTADYVKYDRWGELQSCYPPVEVVKDVMAMGPEQWRLPYLSAVVEVPTLRPDGTVLDRPGYDATSFVYYSPASNLVMEAVPEKPTQQDLADAVEILDEAIGEFPYDVAASRANLFALLLTPILRPALNCPTPLAVIDAPQAGSGKSLIVDVVSIICTGRPCGMIPFPYQDDEMRKQIGASLRKSAQLICFDNVESDLKSPVLALALTANEYQTRILGASEEMRVPNQATWIVTGNNIKPGGDMPRRCYQIRLNALTSKPFMGRTFKHPNLKQWVSEHRGELLHALLTMARYWYSRDAPTLVTDLVGSFEDWCRIVGSIVTCAKVGPFLGNYDVFIEEEDEGPRQWEAFLHAIAGEFPDYFTVMDLIHAMDNSTGSVKNSIPLDVIDVMEKKSNPSLVIGKMLQRRRDRRYGFGISRCWLERESGLDKRPGAARWRVVIAEVSESGFVIPATES